MVFAAALGFTWSFFIPAGDVNCPQGVLGCSLWMCPNHQSFVPRLRRHGKYYCNIDASTWWRSHRWDFDQHGLSIGILPHSMGCDSLHRLRRTEGNFHHKWHPYSYHFRCAYHHNLRLPWRHCSFTEAECTARNLLLQLWSQFLWRIEVCLWAWRWKHRGFIFNHVLQWWIDVRIYQ